jgi:hypothetical protein
MPNECSRVCGSLTRDDGERKTSGHHGKKKPRLAPGLKWYFRDE